MSCYKQVVVADRLANVMQIIAYFSIVMVNRLLKWQNRHGGQNCFQLKGKPFRSFFCSPEPKFTGDNYAGANGSFTNRDYPASDYS